MDVSDLKVVTTVGDNYNLEVKIGGAMHIIANVSGETNANMFAASFIMFGALERINKAINDKGLQDRFGHSQQYVVEAVEKAKGE